MSIILNIVASGPFATQTNSRYTFRLATAQTGGGFLFACNAYCSPLVIIVVEGFFEHNLTDYYRLVEIDLKYSYPFCQCCQFPYRPRVYSCPTT
uniref:Uncharacterized protein n=1 Tax=Utricularia reniformis TaxID=192314 RepID=A0A1Y0B0S9_9LAMI|nr:hypothetical protein AEK19_MT0808 [Utricularia reniformis]ART31045.1 hypothetical protein AEK19_MT0808 [Utricularia reniformis]